MIAFKKLLNKKILGGLITLAGIGSIGTISFLNRENPQPQPTEENKEKPIEPQINNEDPAVPEIPKEADNQKEENVVEREEEAKSEEDPQDKLPEVTVRSGRIYSAEDEKALAARRDADEAFGSIKTELTWKGRTSNLTEEQKTSAKNKFRDASLFKDLGEGRELIDYQDYEGWRIKTSMYLRSDQYSPKDLHTEIDKETIDISNDEGREQYAWRLRETCYEAASYIDDEAKLKATFAVHEESYDNLVVTNLCTFPKQSS